MIYDGLELGHTGWNACWNCEMLSVLICMEGFCHETYRGQSIRVIMGGDDNGGRIPSCSRKHTLKVQWPITLNDLTKDFFFFFKWRHPNACASVRFWSVLFFGWGAPEANASTLSCDNVSVPSPPAWLWSYRWWSWQGCCCSQESERQWPGPCYEELARKEG